jgi:hypothetical protein
VTTDRLIKDLPNYDAVFHIGDLSYANGFLAQWDQFTRKSSPSPRRCRTWWQGSFTESYGSVSPDAY